jgi:hypothetical protein
MSKKKIQKEEKSEEEDEENDEEEEEYDSKECPLPRKKMHKDHERISKEEHENEEDDDDSKECPPSKKTKREVHKKRSEIRKKRSHATLEDIKVINSIKDDKEMLKACKAYLDHALNSKTSKNMVHYIDELKALLTSGASSPETMTKTRILQFTELMMRIKEYTDSFRESGFVELLKVMNSRSSTSRFSTILPERKKRKPTDE